MKIGTWLLSLLQPAIAKILLALGFSVVTITGVDTVITKAQNHLLAMMNTVPMDMLQLFKIGGGSTALGFVLAAIGVRLTLWKIRSAVKVLGVNPG